MSKQKRNGNRETKKPKSTIRKLPVIAAEAQTRLLGKIAPAKPPGK